MKATAQAPSNIAFVKYWGKRNDKLTLPHNSSISMNLADLFTVTTVEFNKAFAEDSVEVAFHSSPAVTLSGTKKQRVINQLDRLRKLAKVSTKAKVVSKNNFPDGVGIASSASAFAALTMAAVAALEMKVSKKELSILTRLGGSGSAVRSVLDGFVEWRASSKSSDSYAVQLLSETEWMLYDVVLVVSTSEKKTSSLEGHHLAESSPYYQARLKELPTRLKKIKQAIKKRDFTTLGEESEKDALSLHFMAMTSSPQIWYWTGATVEILQEVMSLREQGTEVYFTIDAGPNVHILCQPADVKKVCRHFANKKYVTEIFSSPVGKGARLITQHLF